MRSCAPVWLIVLALSASLGLAGCASLDELKATVTGSSAKFPGGDERVLSENPPEETERAEASKAAKKTDKPVRSRQPPQTVKLPRGSPASAPAEAVRLQETDAKSASSQTTPSRLRNLWPKSPAPGIFSR